MRILRSTMYAPDLTPITTVVRDSDMIDTLESVRESVKTPGYFCTFEIFDVPEDMEIETVTMVAMERLTALGEAPRNQAIQFYWATMQFQLVSDDGAVIMPEPAPLSTDQVVEVFQQIPDHPDYKRQTLVASSMEGEVITLSAGKVEVTDGPR